MSPAPPLRILHVTPYYEGAWAYGGIPRVVGALTHGLAARGHRVTVCTTDVFLEDQRLDAVPPGDVDVHVFRNLSNRLAYQFQVFTPRGLGPFMRDHAQDFDVAHIHACRNLPGTIATRHLHRAGVPYIVAPHGTAPRIERRFVAKAIFDATFGRGFMANAARVLAVSDAERRQLLALGIDDDQIATIPNPIDFSEFERPVARGEFRAARGLGKAPVVLFLGKLTPRKRLDILARAFAPLKHPDAHLVIAGNDMGCGRSLRQQLNAIGLSSRATFTGLLTGRERLDALADADVVAYASKDEVFGLVPLEAILCGTPVVVADDSGCGEIIRNVGGGLAVREGDAKALTEALTTILDAAPTWRQAAIKAQPAVRELCRVDTICARLEEVYRSAIGS